MVTSPRGLRAVLPVAVSLGAILLPAVAHATSVLEFPDNGSEQMGRGGAWVARASDPLAAFYNPAGLAGQETRLTLQSNFAIQKTCFTRVKSSNDPTNEALADPNGKFPQVCGSTTPGIDPQLGLTYRLSDRVGIGILPLLAPSAANSNVTWPSFVNDSRGVPQAAPQRYLLLSSNLVLVTPTIGIGIEVAEGFRIGAAFELGIATFDFTTASVGVNGSASGGQPQPSANDITAELKGHDYFIPGFTAGMLWSATDSFDLAGWYHYQAPIDASGDITTQANYFTGAVAKGNKSGIASGDTSQANCGVPNGPPICGNGNNAQIKLVLPMEAKLGIRFHKLRSDVPIRRHTRDPIAQDVFDAEMDLTWANNSAADYLQIRFPGDANGEGTIPINGTPGNAPPNADIRHHFMDTVGVRIGGDYNAIPDRLALRAGGFFETKGQDMQYQGLDIIGSQRFGFAIGGTYRVKLGKEQKSALEIMAGLMHVFFADEDNSASTPGAGQGALAGTNCDPHETPSPNPNCANGTQKFRTLWPVNLGTITNSINVLNVGLSYRF